MRASTMWLSAAALLLAACASCSSSSSGKGGSGSGSGSGSGGDGGMSGSSSGGTGVSLTQACADVAKATCTQTRTCNPFGTAVAYGDEPTCEQRAALACMPLVGASGSSLTPASIDPCAQAIMGETCAELGDNSQPSACDFKGSAAAGAACGTNAQCQSGYCRLTFGTACGTCEARAGAGQAGPDGGATCASDFDCQANLLCAAGQCVAPAMVGGSCSAQQPCSHTLACIGGKCATPVAVGGACTALTDCDGASGAVCNTMTKVCIAIGKATTGQACGIVNGGFTECTGGATCGNVAMGQGTCHQPAADGAPCGPSIGCMLPAVCTTSAKCTLPDPATCH